MPRPVPASVRARSRQFLLIVVAAAFVAVAPVLIATARAAVPPPPSGWTVAFSDDFNGTAGTGLNTNDWRYDLGSSYPGGVANWGEPADFVNVNWFTFGH
jgi:hypothetical protein